MAGGRFVGREAERALLRRELDAALGGEGRLVLLTGEPGTGKTRTATALAAEARERGTTVLWGRCHARGEAPVYWPLVQVLAGYAGARTSPAAEDVAAALAGLRAREELPGEAPPERARFELFDCVALALSAAARARPLLVVVDDLHWADVGSLRLLEFLARELRAARLLLLATLRDLEPPTSAEQAALLGAVVQLGQSVRLSGLARPAVAQLLGDCLGYAPADDVTERVVAATAGNPFFVIELAQLVVEGTASALPPGVQELLRQRLEPLTPRARRLLEAAAVIGPEFELAPLGGVLAETPAALLAGLAEPLGVGLVKELPGTLRRYAFSHSLLRDALYGTLAPAARSALHARVAEALEAAPADEARLSALAHHYFQAAQAADPAKAVRYGCEAGERALRLFAFEEAAGHFERALAALALANDDAARLRALAGLGEALRGAGEPARADAAFRDAIALARREGGEVFARTVLRFSLARAEASVPDVEIDALLEEALAGCAGAPAALRARLLARLAAGLHLQPGAEQRRRRLSDEATSLARALGDPATLGFVLRRRLVGLLGPDDLAERITTTDEILRAPPVSRGAELEALAYRVDDLAERADRTGLDQALARFEQRSSASREPFFLWTAASLRTALALLEGRFGEAETLAADALALGRKAQARTATLRFAQQLFTLRGWQARLAEVEPLLGAGLAETRVVPAWRCALADFYTVVERETEARREYEALAAGGFREIPRDSNWLTSLALLASVCGRLRDAPGAGLLYELLRPYAARVAVSRFAVMLGPIEQRLGVLSDALGEPERGEAHFARALAVAEQMRAPPWQAETRYLWAALLARRGAPGDRERARVLLEQAEATAGALGMELLLHWIRRLRGAEPGAAAAPALRAGAFRRDGDVWSLVFEGRTTRIRDMIGLGHIARLLAEPGRDVPALELVAAAYAGRREPAGADARGDAGEVLDARARAEYEARVREAREELEAATRDHDRGRIERLGEEIEFLAGEVARGFGLGGRPRRAGSDGERARLSVTRAIRYAIDRIGEHDPALAEHLRRGIQTGASCSYERSSRDPVSWSC